MSPNPGQGGDAQGLREDGTWVKPEGRYLWEVKDQCGQDSGMQAREKSNMCKGLKLKNAGPYSGNCGSKSKNISSWSKQHSHVYT